MKTWMDSSNVGILLKWVRLSDWLSSCESATTYTLVYTQTDWPKSPNVTVALGRTQGLKQKILFKIE